MISASSSLRRSSLDLILALESFRELAHSQTFKDDELWRMFVHDLTVLASDDGSFRTARDMQSSLTMTSSNRVAGEEIKGGVQSPSTRISLSDLHPDLQRTIDHGISPSVKLLLNDKYQMVWKFERVFYAQLFGVERARVILGHFLGNLPRALLFMSVLLAALVVATLGLLKIVPSGAFIAAVIVGTIHNFHLRAMLCDTSIYRNLLVNFYSLINIFTTVAAGILGAMLLDWDYRGFMLIVSSVPVAMDLISYEATNHNVRRALVAIWAAIIVQMTLLILLFNMGLVPDIKVDSVLFSVEIDNMLIPFTTLSVYTQTMTANLLLVVNHLLFNHQWVNRLSSALVHLEGVDDPASTPLERLEYLGHTVRICRPDHR